MKSIRLYISLLFLVCTTEAMGQCLTNWDFDDYCGSQTLGCATFKTGCVTNWLRSHGTPELVTPGPTAKDNLMYMWSANSNGLRGEGIFASFNFQTSKPYLIKIRYQTAMASGTGQINIFAANNMVEAPLDTIVCGGGVPNVSSKEQIAQITEGNKAWTVQTINYVPTGNYSQVWLYPYNTSTTQFNFYVDYISVCLDSCGATVNYTNTNLSNGQLPTGINRAGVFNINGTSLSVAADQNTTLIAAQHIVIQPTFNAVVTSGAFIAKIEPCDSNNISSKKTNFQDRQNIDISQLPIESKNSLQKKNESFKILKTADESLNIYPNPTRTILNIEFETNNNSREKKIKLINSSGIIIKTFKSNKTQVQVNINDLPNGTYFIQTVDVKGNSITRKFEKIK